MRESPPAEGRMQAGKHPQIIGTKVQPPRCVGLIERRRLLDLVTQVQTKRLSVIKGPAGFGKTSLAVAWADRLLQSGNSVAWFSIDANDNQPTQFLLYVSNALQRACDGLGIPAIDLLLEASLIDPQAIIATLINGLVEIDQEVCLFLEDYHWVSDPVIHDAVAFLLRLAPSHFHLVLVTRTEPPLSLAGLRAQNQLLEVDSTALRFDLNETRQFFEHEGLGPLDPTDLRLLHERTEGWPAVLRIAASTSSQSGRSLGQYVGQLSGTLRPVGAYLAEMVDSLPRDMALFMLHTAVLDRFCAPLCQAVTQHKSSREFLDSIANRQLLLVPLDHDGRWYRYHALLTGYLRQRLEAEQGRTEIATLHQRASHWYATQELWTEAVQHAIAAGDTEQAASWVKNCAMALVKKGDLLTLLGWQRLFPMVGSPTEIKLAIAWGMALAIRIEDMLQLLRQVESDLSAEQSAESAALACECTTIRSVAIALGDDSQGALSLAEDCLNRTHDPWTANVASNVARFGYLKAGDLTNFYATPWIPYSLDEDRRNVFASVYRRCLQGLAEVQQLRLSAAERYYLDAAALAEQHVGPNSVAAALPFSLLAQIRYEQGRMDEAEGMLFERLPILSSAAMLDCVLSAYFVLVRLAVSRRNFSRAYTLLERAESLGLARGWGRLVSATLFERVRLSCPEGRVSESLACLDRLDRLAEKHPAPEPCAWSDIHRYSALARVYVALSQDHSQSAISIVESLQRQAGDAHCYYFGLPLRTCLATAYLRAGDRNEAVAAFRQVLNVGSQVGLYQSILDQGPEIGPLLSSVRDDAARTGGAGDLVCYLDRLAEGYTARYQPQVKGIPNSAIVEPLSGREGDILNLIAQGRSDKEIARMLSIAPETVKSHVKHIFIKLNVQKRAQAVSRAQNLGLV
jgi:LuxR family transcriptional regulator, maltose regulon positive regulatory protein